MTIRISSTEDPVNRAATAMVLDLRNSTALLRLLKSKDKRMLIIKMMIGIHEEVINYLYESSGVKESDFAFNDTGDGYLIVFANESHAISCVQCALHLRTVLRRHIAEYNRALKIVRANLRYDFGIGVHTAYARFIEMECKTGGDKIFSKQIILGNAVNSAARVESMTKNFFDIDLLITENTRYNCQKQAAGKVKNLFKKNGGYMKVIGEVRHMVRDSKPDGHTLYTLSAKFNSHYKELLGMGKH
jgi:class 3 adenylate cyclase